MILLACTPYSISGALSGIHTSESNNLQKKARASLGNLAGHSTEYWLIQLSSLRLPLVICNVTNPRLRVDEIDCHGRKPSPHRRQPPFHPEDRLPFYQCTREEVLYLAAYSSLLFEGSPCDRWYSKNMSLGWMPVMVYNAARFVDCKVLYE